MKSSSIMASALAFGSLSIAYPGMDAALKEVKSRSTGQKSTELLGDLVTRGATTNVGSIIQNILTSGESPESSELYNGDLPSKSSDACKQDTCCIWKWIANEMQNVFKGPGGRCTDFARQAIRLGFHDAGAWEKGASHGGADGSVVLSADEMGRRENTGLQDVGRLMHGWYDRYKEYGVTMADVIQMGANVATVVCPLGPRVRSFVGRKDNPKAAVEGLIPSPNDSADSLIAMFERKTISADGLVALVGAHTTSQQQFSNPDRKFDPQDSTPGVWDALFYGQTLGTVTVPKRVISFPSDMNLAADPRTSGTWKKFAGPGGQGAWNRDYAREYVRLSLLGVDNINELTECTKVLPATTGSYDTRDDEIVYEEWLGGEHNEISIKLLDGDVVVLS